MIDFLQTTEGIITAASVYLLVGLSWNLVFNACGYLNLALGQYYILGAIFSYKLESSWGIHSPFLLAPMIAISVGFLGFISERFMLRPLKDRGLSPLIVTIGINLMLLQLAKSLSPGLVIRPDTFVNGQISPGGVHIAYQELIVWGTAIVLTAALFLFFRRTDLGRSMRASVDNRRAADTLGLKVAGESENYGPEQERLNSVFGARLHITALRAASGPGIEFLEYLAPRDGRPYPPEEKANDLIHWQTRFLSSSADEAARTLRDGKSAFVSTGAVELQDGNAGFRKAITVRDPDGHAIQVVEQ